MSVSLLVQSEHRQYIISQIHYKGNVLKTPTSFPVCELWGRRLSECGLSERRLSGWCVKYYGKHSLDRGLSGSRLYDSLGLEGKNTFGLCHLAQTQRFWTWTLCRRGLSGCGLSGRGLSGKRDSLDADSLDADSLARADSASEHSLDADSQDAESERADSASEHCLGADSERVNSLNADSASEPSLGADSERVNSLGADSERVDSLGVDSLGADSLSADYASEHSDLVTLSFCRSQCFGLQGRRNLRYSL